MEPQTREVWRALTQRAIPTLLRHLQEMKVKARGHTALPVFSLGVGGTEPSVSQGFFAPNNAESNNLLRFSKPLSAAWFLV